VEWERKINKYVNTMAWVLLDSVSITATVHVDFTKIYVEE
jgi:hypothetical protein